MARVAWLIISENNTGGQELIIHEPISRIVLKSLDEQSSFFLTFSLIELTETRDYSIDIEIGEVHGKILLDIDSDLAFHNHGNPNFDIFTNEISISDFTFSKEGIHYVKLTVDKKHTQEIFFKVRLEGDQDE